MKNALSLCFAQVLKSQTTPPFSYLPSRDLWLSLAPFIGFIAVPIREEEEKPTHTILLGLEVTIPFFFANSLIFIDFGLSYQHSY